jgi:hypothetical protein
MALLNIGFNFGVFSSIIINALACYLLFYIFVKIGILTQSISATLIVAFLMFLNPEMMDCYSGGSTIPLGILIFACTSYVIIKSTRSIDSIGAVALALLAGAGVLNRFDYLPIAIAISAAIIIRNKAINPAILAIYYTVFLLVISPWVIYSELHFGVIFITDNGRRLLNIQDTRPSTFFPASSPALTLFDNPHLWLKESLKRWINANSSVYSFISKYTYVKEAIFAFIFLKVLRYKKPKASLFKDCTDQGKIAGLLFATVFVQTAAIILTGYPDMRYHILFSFFAFYIITASLLRVNKFSCKTDFCMSAILPILAFSIILPKTDTYVIERSAYKIFTLFGKHSNTRSSLVLAENLDAEKYLNQINEPRLILNRDERTMDIAKYSALCHQVTIMSPSNLDTSNVKPFVEFFHLNYLYTSDSNQLEIFRSKLSIIPTGVYHLYKIELPDAQENSRAENHGGGLLRTIACNPSQFKCLKHLTCKAFMKQNEIAENIKRINTNMPDSSICQGNIMLNSTRVHSLGRPSVWTFS